MNKFFALMFFLVIISVSGTVNATVIVELVPNTATVNSGDTLNIDIIISGLIAGGAPSVGVFEFDVEFDPAILDPVTVTFGSMLGDPAAFEALTDFQFLPSVVNLAEVSLLSPAALDALQLASFTLATLSFRAIADGTANLSFARVIVDDPYGNLIAGNKVPEPDIIALLTIGIIGLIAFRRKTVYS